VNKALKFAIMLSAATLAFAVPVFAGTVTYGSVPEPITLTLLATGIGAVAVVRRLRTK
jgi:hypothetical protein